MARREGAREAQPGRHELLGTTRGHEQSHRQLLVILEVVLFLPDQIVIVPGNDRTSDQIAPEQSGFREHRIQSKQPAERVTPENAPGGIHAVIFLCEWNNLRLDESQKLGAISRALLRSRA